MRNLTSHSLLAPVASLLLATGALVAPHAWGQQAPAGNPSHDSPSPADLEPGVNTSAPPPADAPVTPAAPASKRSATVASKPDSTAASEKTAGAKSADAKPVGDTRVAKAPASKDTQAGGKGSGKAQDHLQLDTTQITGNQELPKVLYIVPWKRSDLGDLLGKPANSLIDEVLQPVDRDVFRRENRYYDAVKPGADAGGAGQTSAEKH
jgi:outer membrane biosynthesis protein TonB